MTCWTLTHDNGLRCGVMTTNASKSFNGIIKRARGLPIKAMITTIYYNLVHIFLYQLINVQTTDLVTQKIEESLYKIGLEARRMSNFTRINLIEF